MQLDFSQVKEDLISESFHNFMISNVELKMTKTGYEMLSVRYAVMDGEYEGRIIHDFFIPSHPKCKWHKSRLMKLCLACGIIGIMEHEAQLENKFFNAEVIHQTDKEGKTKETVRNFLPYNTNSLIIEKTVVEKKSEKMTYNINDLDDIPF